MEYDYLPVSSTDADASLMHIQTDRLTGATTFDVDTVTNVPAKFIGVAGTLLATGILDPTTMDYFKGHVSGSDIIIDDFVLGSVDNGNTAGQVIIIKPNTYWANLVAHHVMNMTGFGTPENVTFDDFDASGNGTIDGNLTVTGNLNVTGNTRPKPRVSAATTATTLTPNIDNFNFYELSAQATALTIGAPSGTPNDKDTFIFFIKDSGTSRAITWNAAYVNISGLDTVTATTAGKWHTFGIVYNAGLSKWQVVSITTEA